MAVLTAAIRKKMPSKDFAGPGRSFPTEDKIHAEKALQFVGKAERLGHITPEEAAHIRAMAHARLGK